MKQKTHKKVKIFIVASHVRNVLFEMQNSKECLKKSFQNIQSCNRKFINLLIYLDVKEKFQWIEEAFGYTERLYSEEHCEINNCCFFRYPFFIWLIIGAETG